MEKKNIAVVTGASGGLGREFVRLLAKDPEIDEVWAIARNEEKLYHLKKKIGKKVKTYSADLSNRKELQVFAAEFEREQVSIRWLINNAGFAKFCTYDDISIDESMNMIDLNVSAVVAFGLIALPFMERGSHIVNIASQASFQPLPYLNIYAATKAFVRNYTRALHLELKERGITATAVCPGWMQTGLMDRGHVETAKAISVFPFLSTPAKVAAKALRDAKKGKDISVYGFYVKCCHVVAKLLPQRCMMRLWLKQQHLI